MIIIIIIIKQPRNITKTFSIFQWGITDDCTDSVTNKVYKDWEVFVKDCTDICVCRRRHISCDDKFCPEIGNVQCPPHSVPIYQDQDITHFGVTCKCKSKISSTAQKTCFNRIALLETTRSLFVVIRDFKIQRRRRPLKRHLKRQLSFFQSSSQLFQLISLELNF